MVDEQISDPDMSYSLKSLMCGLFEEWPERLEAQSYLYPVDGYIESHTNMDKWNPYTYHGKRRITLLTYMINEVDKLIQLHCM